MPREQNFLHQHESDFPVAVLELYFGASSEADAWPPIGTFEAFSYLYKTFLLSTYDTSKEEHAVSTRDRPNTLTQGGPEKLMSHFSMSKIHVSFLFFSLIFSREQEIRIDATAEDDHTESKHEGMIKKLPGKGIHTETLGYRIWAGRGETAKGFIQHWRIVDLLLL